MYELKVKNGSSGANLETLSASDDIYDANIPAYDTFGNGLTASFSKKVNTSAVAGNTKYLDFADEASTQYFKMGTVAQFNDSDNFFFRRLLDSWTISFWMKVPSGGWNSSDSYANPDYIFHTGCDTVWEESGG